MPDQMQDRRDMLKRRMDLVGSISAITAEAQRLNQRYAAIEMDLQRCQMAIERTGQTDELVRDLHKASEDAEALEGERDDCEARIVAAEEELDAIDRMLEASQDV